MYKLLITLVINLLISIFGFDYLKGYMLIERFMLPVCLTRSCLTRGPTVLVIYIVGVLSYQHLCFNMNQRQIFHASIISGL